MPVEVSHDRRPPRVLLGISAGIAAYKAAVLVRQLVEAGFEVRCALTPKAAKFVSPLTLEVLSGYPVYGEEYLDSGQSGEELHVTTAQWADVLCVAPATANTLARLALGLANDFLTTTALMFEGPTLVAPAMHSAMWLKATVQDHVDVLRRRDVRVLGPVDGRLASGESGPGRMVEPEEIAAAVAEAYNDATHPGRRSLAGHTVLVSAGPTYEPIDPVRFLGNRSSGKMGFALAAEAARRGAHVFLVAGPVSLPTPPGIERHDVSTALEMRETVHRLAPQSDLIVMAAAVADYRVASPSSQKIKKTDDPAPSLELEQTEDILAGLADVAPAAVRVGFAAETERLEEYAAAKLAAKRVHFLVANDVSRQDIGFGNDDNEVTVFQGDGEPVRLDRRRKSELAAALLDLFEAALTARATAGA